jgi:hypothetical protein
MTLHSNGLFRIWAASGCIDNAGHYLLRLPCQRRKRSFSVRRFILIGTLNKIPVKYVNIVVIYNRCMEEISLINTG